MKTFALVSIGKDRPGIVAKVTQTLARFGANLEDSNMATLGGQFAIMLIVTLRDTSLADELKAALNEASAELDLTTTLSEISTDELKSKEIRPFSVTVYGADHPGIVSGISERIATLEASIVDMTTRVLHSAGGTTYVMVLEVDPPADLTLETIAAELAEQAEALGVSVRVHQAGEELL